MIRKEIKKLKQISMYRVEIKAGVEIENEVIDFDFGIELFMDRYIYITGLKIPKIIKIIGEKNIISIKNISRSTFKKK